MLSRGMRLRVKRIAPLFCLLLSLVSWVIAPIAQADAGLGDGLKPDVRLLIDISGSMKESDPDNLRAPALDLIVRLLPEDSKAGVWIFGHDVEPLVAHRVIDDSWREQAVKAVSEIDNSGQLTNIPAALEAAMYDFDRLDPTYRTSIILLTDGKVDISDSPMTNAQAARKLLADDAPNLGALGIPVHTIALSEEADWGFLRSLAKSTSGLAEKVDTAERLTEVFYQSLEMVAPTSRVPIAGKKFKIDPSVQEFTALAFLDSESAQLGLIAPDGKRYKPDESQSGMEWFRNRKFALVTVSAPQPGQWKLIAPGGANTRVTVISDLRLEVDPLPASIPAGKRAELGLRLREWGKRLTDPEVLSVFKLTVEVKPPRGKRQFIDVMAEYPVPDDGEFRVFIPGLGKPGRYEINVRLEGETLERELPMFVEVLPTAETSIISTLGEEVPEGDFRAPMVSFAGAAVIVGIGLAWFLRRRKRQKLEVWRRRNLDFDSGTTGSNKAVVSGMHAPRKDGDSKS